MIVIRRSRRPRWVVPLVTVAVLAGCAGRDAPPDAAPTPTSTGGDTGAVATPTTEPTTPTPSPSARATVVHATDVPPLHPSVDGYDEANIEIVTAEAVHRIAVLVADTAAERRHGLMEVPELPDGVGMSFVGYDEDRTTGFWMKDTLVPLTIAYVAADGTIVDLVDMSPCRSTACPRYPPARPYRSALEMPQGWFAASGIDEGAVVRGPG